VTEAFATLRDPEKRKTYDNLEFGEVPAYNAHRQFVNLVEDSPEFLADEKNKQLTGLVRKLSTKEKAHKKVEGHHHHHKQHHHVVNPQFITEEFTKEIVHTSGPEGTSSKTVTHRNSIVNGR